MYHQYMTELDSKIYICVLICEYDEIDDDHYGEFNPFEYTKHDDIEELPDSQRDMVYKARKVEKYTIGEQLQWLNELTPTYNGISPVFIQTKCPSVLNLTKEPDCIRISVGPSGHIVEKNSILEAIKKFIKDMNLKVQNPAAMMELKGCLNVLRQNGVNVDDAKTNTFLEQNKLGKL